MTEAGISFIFSWCVVHLHSDLTVPCSNLIRLTVSFCRKHTLGVFLFLKVYQLLMVSYC